MTIAKLSLLLILATTFSSIQAQRGDDATPSAVQKRVEQQRAMVAAELDLDEAQQTAFITNGKITDDKMRETMVELAKVLAKSEQTYAKGWEDLTAILTPHQARQLNHMREQGMLDLMSCPTSGSEAAAQPCAHHSAATPGCCAGPKGATVEPSMKAPAPRKKGEEPPPSKSVLQSR